MLNDTFKIVYFIGFVIILVVRKVYTTKYRKINLKSDQKTAIDIIFLALVGIAMLVPLVYVFSPVLDFANYQLPDWPGWIGAGLFLCSSWVLWRSHADLGSNWTPTLGIRADHILITNGIYAHIRHPMYAAHLLWAVSQALLLHNWIAGYSFLALALPHYLSRVNAEERMMARQFGNAYTEYARRTGRIFPKLVK